MPPYIKQTAGHIHRSDPPTNSSVLFLTFHSHFSRNPLSLCDLVMAPVFFNGIDMLSSPIFYLYSLIYIYIHVSLHSTFIYIFLFLAFDLYLIMLPHFTWKNFLCIYFMFIFFWHFIDQVVWTMDPPPQEPGFHPGDEPFAPNVAIPRFPVPAIVWNIFQHLLFFMLTNKCN